MYPHFYLNAKDCPQAYVSSIPFLLLQFPDSLGQLGYFNYFVNVQRFVFTDTIHFLTFLYYITHLHEIFPFDLSLNIISSSSIQMEAKVKISSFLIAVQYSIIYYSSFMFSLVIGYLGCFLMWQIINRAIININVHIFSR